MAVARPPVGEGRGMVVVDGVPAKEAGGGVALGGRAIGVGVETGDGWESQAMRSMSKISPEATRKIDVMDRQVRWGPRMLFIFLPGDAARPVTPCPEPLCKYIISIGRLRTSRRK